MTLARAIANAFEAAAYLQRCACRVQPPPLGVARAIELAAAVRIVTGLARRAVAGHCGGDGEPRRRSGRGDPGGARAAPRTGWRVADQPFEGAEVLTAAVRGRLVQALQLRIAEAEELERELTEQYTPGAAILASGWLQVAQVWREKLAEVQK